jgi:carbon storage regulator
MFPVDTSGPRCKGVAETTEPESNGSVMLVLTRKQGEALSIGRNVVVRVTAIEGGRVRIGIEAPRGLRIMREECVGAAEWRDISLAAQVECVA